MKFSQWNEAGHSIMLTREIVNQATDRPGKYSTLQLYMQMHTYMYMLDALLVCIRECPILQVSSGEQGQGHSGL